MADCVYEEKPLIEPPAKGIVITDNGLYNVLSYEQVVVNVEGSDGCCVRWTEVSEGQLNMTAGELYELLSSHSGLVVIYSETEDLGTGLDLITGFFHSEETGEYVFYDLERANEFHAASADDYPIAENSK